MMTETKTHRLKNLLRVRRDFRYDKMEFLLENSNKNVLATTTTTTKTTEAVTAATAALRKIDFPICNLQGLLFCKKKWSRTKDSTLLDTPSLTSSSHGEPNPKKQKQSFFNDDDDNNGQHFSSTECEDFSDNFSPTLQYKSNIRIVKHDECDALQLHQDDLKPCTITPVAAESSNDHHSAFSAFHEDKNGQPKDDEMFLHTSNDYNNNINKRKITETPEQTQRDTKNQFLMGHNTQEAGERITTQSDDWFTTSLCPQSDFNFHSNNNEPNVSFTSDGTDVTENIVFPGFAIYPHDNNQNKTIKNKKKNSRNHASDNETNDNDDGHHHPNKLKGKRHELSSTKLEQRIMYLFEFKTNRPLGGRRKNASNKKKDKNTTKKDVPVLVEHLEKLGISTSTSSNNNSNKNFNH